MIALGIVICGAVAQAQQPKKVARIGVLLSGSRSPIWGEAFKQALRELGYIDGQNITIEYRNGEGVTRTPTRAGEGTG